MAIVVEDGTGIENAESYISVADADDYVSKWHGTVTDWTGLDEDWTGLGEAGKERALRMGTRYIDSFEFLGLRAFTAQALSWPRVAVGPIDGQYYTANVVPDAIASATVEAALKVAKGEDLFPVHQGGAIQSESSGVGPLSESVTYFSAKRPEKTFEAVQKLLHPFLVGSRRTLVRGMG